MSRKQFYKNSSCTCFGLLLVSISAFVMIQIFFDKEISQQIQSVSVLKDIKYPSWGKNPNPSGSQYLQTFTLFSLEEMDGQIHATKSNSSKTFEYTYQYQNVSFEQGNSGRLNFINKWGLKQVTENAPTQQTIKTINLAADKIYNYDYYAPPQRKIPILYNYLLNSLTNQFLQKFYSLYLLQFFFQHKDLVYETVFKPLNIEQERATFIYEHPQYGWSTIDNFKSWVRLSLKGKLYAQSTQQYEALIVQLNLSPKEISNLVFQKSTLHNMISALNGTIQSKLAQSKFFGYKCESDVCSNQQLAAFQISSAFLTQDPLFSSLGLNITTKDLNNTFLADIEYTKFCEKNKGAFTCMPDQSKAQFFTKHLLGDFQMMNLLWTNKDNTDYIEDQFKLPQGTGKSLVEYVNYIYQQMIKKYQNNIFAWAQTNYNHIQDTVTAYKNLFLVQLYSRAFEKKFILHTDKSCEDYFSGDFAEYQQKVCKSETQTWNFLKSPALIRKYVQAYFFINNMRILMNKQLGMSFQIIIKFFKDAQKSLFAKQISQIDQIFRTSFGCPQNTLNICQPSQLFCMQWGQNKVLQNLPTDIFSNKVGSINEWDTGNILNGINPDYNAIIGKTKTVPQCLDMLSSNSKQGVFSFFNLLSIGKRSQVDEDARNTLKYVGRNVISISFKGLLASQDVNDIFTGFKSDLIQTKRTMNVSSGGAPWLQNQIKLIKTDNKQEIKNNELQLNPQYDTINTGIYNQDKTREITKIWGESTSSSKYIVYRGTKQDDDGKQVSVDIFQKYVTDRKISGTNLLGFQPYIEQGYNLLAYISQAYQSMMLNFDSQVAYEDEKQLSSSIRAIKYKISFNGNQHANSSFIGIEQLNQNFFYLSPQSYAIVQPTTGLTLQMKLIYTIKANLLFTNFLLEQQKPVSLYQSQIYYKRKSLSQLEQINTDANSKSLFTLITIIVGAGSFILFAGLGAMYFKNRKFKDQIEQSLVSLEKDEDI